MTRGPGRRRSRAQDARDGALSFVIELGVVVFGVVAAVVLAIVVLAVT